MSVLGYSDTAGLSPVYLFSRTDAGRVYLSYKRTSSLPKKKRERKGAVLPEYISAQNLAPFVPKDVEEALLNPITYLTKSGTEAQGVPATVLPEICNIWLVCREKGALTPRQEITAKKAEILMRGLAHIGIIALVLIILKCLRNAEPTGDCPNCDYDFTGIRGSRKITCPECGHIIAAGEDV